MNIFDEALTALKSKVQVRKLFHDTHAEDLQRVISRVTAIYEEKAAAQEEVERQKARKKEALEAVTKQMKKLGLSAADVKALMEDKGNDGRKGKTRQRYLFRYVTENGSSVDWEGATTGRVPADFTAYLERTGKDRKSCIVKKL